MEDKEILIHIHNRLADIQNLLLLVERDKAPDWLRREIDNAMDTANHLPLPKPKAK